MDQKPYSGRRLSALKGIVGTAEIRRMVQTACCENGEYHSSTMLIAELMESFQNGTIEEWEYLPKNSFEKVVSFLVEKESVEEMREYLSKTLESARENAQNNQWNGQFQETNWNKWQEHMESLIETLRKILEQDGEVLDLIPQTKQEMSEEHIEGGMNME